MSAFTGSKYTEYPRMSHGARTDDGALKQSMLMIDMGFQLIFSREDLLLSELVLARLLCVTIRYVREGIY